MTIAYILGQFPSHTEHFIHNEIVELGSRGINIRILALQRGPAGALPAAAGSGARYRGAFFSFATLAAHAFLASRSGARYFRVLGNALSSGAFRPAPLLKRIRDFSTAVCFLHALRDGPVTHLHAHFASLPTRIAGIMSALSGIPFSCSAHANDIYTTPPAELVKNLAGARFIVTCTAYNKVYLDGVLAAGAPKRVMHVYHGIDLSGWAWQDRPFAFTAGHVLHILTVGRLVEKKGIMYLLEAVRQLRETGRPVRLSVVGEGPCRPRLAAYIAQHGLGPVVQLHGALTQPEVKALYQVADVFVLPCTVTGNGDRDGLPNVLMEALAVGLPVISTAVSAIPELIRDGETGLLIPEKSAAGILDALERLGKDPRLCRELARNGREKLEQAFSIEVSTNQLVGLFR